MSEDQIDALKLQVKKSTGKEVDIEIKSAGLQFTTDLKNFEYEYMGYILTLYDQWEKGNMPFNGCVSEQPNKIIEIMNLINSLRLEQNEKLQKEHKRENDRANK